MFSFELSSIYRNSDIYSKFTKFIGSSIIQVGLGFSVPNKPRTTSQVGCESPLWAISFVITPVCLYTFGRVYWVLSMGRIHRTLNLAHVVLLSVISSSYSSVRLSALTIYQYIQYSIQHDINWTLHQVS